jgi:mono/diheme cytochrome c family protein
VRGARGAAPLPSPRLATAAAFLVQALVALALPAATHPSEAGPAAPAAALGPEAPADLAHGQRVLQDFCLSCHVLDVGKGNPLRPRLRPEVWSDPARAYANIGDLVSLNRSMNQPFRGSDADRRALALALAHLAEQNRVPAWRAALPYAGLAAAVAGAGAYLAWARRRSRGR